MADDDELLPAEALCQVLGQLDGVGDQLTDVHRHSWLDGRSGLARTALIPFDDDEVILEEPVEPDSRHLGLTRTAVQLQQDRALGAPASHQQPLPYAPSVNGSSLATLPGTARPCESRIGLVRVDGPSCERTDTRQPYRSAPDG